MADHYLRSIEHLEELADLRQELREAYAAPRQDRSRIADLHQSIGCAIKLADVHANLAVRQELQEIATSLQFQGIRP